MTNQPFKRTRSMELRAIREQIKESPPPAPAGASMREWFTGLALMNPSLMQDVPDDLRANEAVRLADEVIKALMMPKTPSQESMTVPIEEEGLVKSWNSMANSMKAADKKDRQTRETKPPPGRAQQRTRTAAFGAILPPPLVEEQPVVTVPPQQRPTLPDRPTLVSGPKLQRPITPLKSFSTDGRYAHHFRGNLGTDLEGPAIKHFEEE